MVRGVFLLAIVGCYNPPRIQPCTISCANPGDCVDGLSCIDGLCKTQLGTCGGDDAMPADMGPPVDAGFCFGRPEKGGLFQICVPDMPTGSMELISPIDTDATCLPQAAAVCVLLADKISVGTTIIASGSRPLLLIGASSVTIEGTGTIDVASQNTRGGAGAGARTDCMQAIDGTEAALGSPGGAGGSYGGLGGGGGDGAGITAPPAPVAGAVDGVEGGCPGGKGGAGGVAGSTAQAAGGRGGGAVYVISSSMIEVSGTINASGEGGAGGVDARAGGGGGGSGGLIGFDAPTILLSGGETLFANGGGGGEGGAQGGNGARGADPSGLTSALGGANQTNGGDGGAGSSTSGSGFPGATVNGANLGGGGGGGGGGQILFVAPQQPVTCGTTNCSPAPKQTPP